MRNPTPSNKTLSGVKPAQSPFNVEGSKESAVFSVLAYIVIPAMCGVKILQPGAFTLVKSSGVTHEELRDMVSLLVSGGKLKSVRQETTDLAADVFKSIWPTGGKEFTEEQFSMCLDKAKAAASFFSRYDSWRIKSENQ